MSTALNKTPKHCLSFLNYYKYVPYLQVADIGSTETHVCLLSQLIQAVQGMNCFGGQVQIFRL